MTICSPRCACRCTPALARTYIALRGADAQAALLARTIKVYQVALKLTQERLNQNIAPPIDVERAKVQLASAQAAAADIAQGRAVLENALAVLAGQTASFFKIAAEARQPATPRPPRAAPASLLLRRPDVAANERLLFAASERIGAAKADFLPRFYILLSGGTQSTNLNLLNFHNSLWSYGPAINAPVFDGGQRQAQLDIARDDFKVAAGEYKASVLVGLSGSRGRPGVDQAAERGTQGAGGRRARRRSARSTCRWPSTRTARRPRSMS